MSNIFISRELKEQSLFYSSFGKEVNIAAYSLLEFAAVPFYLPKSIDMVFFYSRNAVSFFFSQIKNADFTAAWCCLGVGTADMLESLGYSPIFVGNGTPEEIALTFKKIALGKKVLFPRARHSRKSIQTHIQDEVEVIDLVVYDNRWKENFPHPKADILIFTSPMNAAAYFDRYEYQNEFLVAIGNTTKNKLNELGFDQVQIPSESCEASLVDKVKDIIVQFNDGR